MYVAALGGVGFWEHIARSALSQERALSGRVADLSRNHDRRVIHQCTLDSFRDKLLLLSPV